MNTFLPEIGLAVDSWSVENSVITICRTHGRRTENQIKMKNVLRGKNCSYKSLNPYEPTREKHLLQLSAFIINTVISPPPPHPHVFRNGLFAAYGNMVQNPSCWRASFALRHPKQSYFIQSNFFFYTSHLNGQLDP